MNLIIKTSILECKIILTVGALMIILLFPCLGYAQFLQFQSSYPTINLGASTNIYLTTTTSGSITSSNGNFYISIPSAGSFYYVFYPTVTTTYFFIPTASAMGSQSTTVTVIEPPTINSFYGTRSSVTSNNTCLTLNWNIANASSATITGIGNVNASSGGWTVCPSVSTVYTLEAMSSSGGNAISSFTVYVGPANLPPPPPPRPSISVFATNTTSTVGGFPALLSWNVGDATSTSISGIGSVYNSGSILVYPNVTTTYTITASGPGGTTTRQVTISVIDILNVENTTVNSGETRRFEATASTRTGGSNRSFTARANSNVFLASGSEVRLQVGTRLDSGSSVRAVTYYRSQISDGTIYGANATSDLPDHVPMRDAAQLRTQALPASFGLDQNTPNPFNPTTVIRYTLKEPTKVSLRIYDVLGREVLNLVDETKPAGRYEARFDGSRLASGVYLYRLQAGEFVQTKRMTLLK